MWLQSATIRSIATVTIDNRISDRFNMLMLQVCCPDVYNTPRPPVNGGQSELLPQPGVCGTDNTNRIIGGEVTKIDEFPWMALIEYSKRKLVVKCLDFFFDRTNESINYQRTIEEDSIVVVF